MKETLQLHLCARPNSHEEQQQILIKHKTVSAVENKWNLNFSAENIKESRAYQIRGVHKPAGEQQ